MTDTADIMPTHDAPPDMSFLDDPNMPPVALAISTKDSNTGECASCGALTIRPAGTSPTGRKKRIPKFCDDCKQTKKPATTTRRKSANMDIAETMTEMYTAVGLMILPKDPALGIAIVGQKRLLELEQAGQGEVQSIAEAAGNAWAHVAANNPMVAQFLTSMTKTTVWGELALAHAGLIPHVAPKIAKRKFTSNIGTKFKFMRFRKANRRRAAASEMNSDAT